MQKKVFQMSQIVIRPLLFAGGYLSRFASRLVRAGMSPGAGSKLSIVEAV